MSATAMAFAAPLDIRHASKVKLRMNHTPEHVVQIITITPTLKSNPDGDLVLSLLNRVQTLIDGIARKRQAKRIARNRVEAYRELAKLPKRVRNDLLFGETPNDHQV